MEYRGHATQSVDDDGTVRKVGILPGYDLESVWALYRMDKMLIQMERTVRSNRRGNRGRCVPVT
jgi:hypothetical protein